MTTTEERVDIQTALDAGMQRRTTRFLAQPSEVFFAKNADFQYILGGITKALGYQKKGATINSGATILGCGSLTKADGTTKLFAFSGTDLYVFDGSSAWVAQGASGLPSSASYETVSFLNESFIAVGESSKAYGYTGSSIYAKGFDTTPSGRYPFVYRSRLYLFHCKVVMNSHGIFRSRVFYTDLPIDDSGSLTAEFGYNATIDLVTTANSPVVTSSIASFLDRGIKVGDPFFIYEGADAGEYEVKTVDSNSQITLTEDLTANASNLDFWVGGNWFDVAPDDGDVGMGLGENNDRLLCFKRFSLYKFNKGVTDEDNSLIRVKNVPGTTSHRSIVNLYDWTFYWSDTGLWRYDGTSSILMSNPIQEIVDGIDATNLTSVVGWVVDQRIVKMFVGDISNSDTGLEIDNCVICYDALSNAYWVEEYDDTIKCSVKWVENSALKNFIFSSDGEAFESETGNSYNGNAFPMEIETHLRFPIAPEISVNFTRFRIYTQHGREITCAVKFAYRPAEGGYRVDDDWRPMQPSYKTQDEQEWLVPIADVKAAGYALKFIENSATNARPVIERIAAYYTGGEVR